MSPLVRGPVFQQEWGPEPGDGCAAAPAALPGAPPPPKSASTAEEVVHLTAQCGAAGADLVSTHYPAGPAPSSTQQAQHDKEGILEKRRQHVGPNVALFFADEPIHAVRGQGCELFDAEGNSYLDCINNVSHVGHAHPRVAAAVASQLAILNTNSRYLSQGLVDYAEQMAALMPSTLEVLYMTVSGSEANDLALRIAHAAARRAQAEDGDTRPLHIAVMDHAYHGHTSALIDLSPYKFNGPGGEGCPAHVHVLPCPDTYRGTNLDGAAAARAAIAAAKASGGRLAGFFSESIISCGGQVQLLPAVPQTYHTCLPGLLEHANAPWSAGNHVQRAACSPGALNGRQGGVFPVARTPLVSHLCAMRPPNHFVHVLELWESCWAGKHHEK